MPKIIENLKERLRQEAFRQIEEVGYGAMTIQSVARQCGVGVGTVYNYYPSKDAMLMEYIRRDWEKCFASICTVSYYSRTYDAVIRCIYDQLAGFNTKYASMFREDTAANSLSAVMMRLMGTISGDIAQALRKFCEGDVEAEIIAEALLIWIRTGKNFDDIYNKIEKLF